MRLPTQKASALTELLPRQLAAPPARSPMPVRLLREEDVLLITVA